MTFDPTFSGLLMKSSVNSEPTSTSTPPISCPSVNGHGNGFGQCPLRMCRSVPQTPQAPTLIRAAFLPIFGHGTLRMTGFAPGPSYVHTRICSMAFPPGPLLMTFSRGAWPSLCEAHHEANARLELDRQLTVAPSPS